MRVSQVSDKPVPMAKPVTLTTAIASDTAANSVFPRWPQNTMLTIPNMKIIIWEMTTGPSLIFCNQAVPSRGNRRETMTPRVCGLCPVYFVILFESPLLQKTPASHRRLRFKYLFLLCIILSFYWVWKNNSLLRQHYRLLTDETHYTKQVKLDEKNRSNIGNAGGTQYHLAYPRNYHFLMDVGDVCESRTPFLVLMVPVEPKNVAARDAIRSTWGKEKVVQGKKVLTLFMLGLAEGPNLRQENELHGDLIQSDFRDTYLNLTIKTMVIMDWLATRCPTAAYTMKIDTDMFLNIDNLVMMLQKPGIPQTDYLTGKLKRNSPVIRRKSSKWYVSKEMFPYRVYPVYTTGGAYVFSNDLPRKFLEISKWIKPFDIEDAYVGMCMKELGLALTSPPDPSQFQMNYIKFDRCMYSKIITTFLGSPTQLIIIWRQLKMAPGPPC